VRRSSFLTAKNPAGWRARADGADALIDTIALTQLHADQLFDVQSCVGAFVIISSASVYRDPGPASYSTRKVALERMFLERARVPVTVLRACAIHRMGSQHPREWWLIKRILDGCRTIPLAYRGSSRFQTCAAAPVDAARESDRFSGQPVDCAAAKDHLRRCKVQLSKNAQGPALSAGSWMRGVGTTRTGPQPSRPFRSRACRP
jgi:nucleoside-diphosphate-sugar epimerase